MIPTTAPVAIAGQPYGKMPLRQRDWQEAIGITNVTADTDYQDDGADGQAV